jgi:hypothetical protein
MKLSFSFRHVPARFSPTETPKAWRVTNLGWPDPTLWVNDLRTTLEARAAVYEQEPDALLRRNKAAGMLAELLSAIHSLPAFAYSSAHMPLKDLLIFLQDLDIGRAHAWSKPVNFGGTNVTPTAERELRNWAVGLVHILWLAGNCKSEAYRLVATTMTDSGRRGKNGGSVSWRSVQQWYLKTPAPLETIVGKRLAVRWQSAPCIHGQLITHCTSGASRQLMCSESKAIAKMWVQSALQLSTLRDRFHSGDRTKPRPQLCP